jgi:hypothetical protein
MWWVEPGYRRSRSFNATRAGESDRSRSWRYRRNKRTPISARIPTDEQRAARRARERELVQHAVEQLRSSDGWRAWLTARSRFRAYSLHNQLLIAFQRAGSHCLLGRGGVDIRSSGRGRPCRGWLSGLGSGSRAEFGVFVGLFVTGVVGAIAGSGRRIVAAVPAAVGRAKPRDARGTTAGGL